LTSSKTLPMDMRTEFFSVYDDDKSPSVRVASWRTKVGTDPFPKDVIPLPNELMPGNPVLAPVELVAPLFIEPVE